MTSIQELLAKEEIKQARRALKLAEMDKARLQEALSRVTALVEKQAPILYERIADGLLSDLTETTEAWLVQHIEPLNDLHQDARNQAG